MNLPSDLFTESGQTLENSLLAVSNPILSKTNHLRTLAEIYTIHSSALLSNFCCKKIQKDNVKLAKSWFFSESCLQFADFVLNFDEMFAEFSQNAI